MQTPGRQHQMPGLNVGIEVMRSTSTSVAAFPPLANGMTHRHSMSVTAILVHCGNVDMHPYTFSAEPFSIALYSYSTIYYINDSYCFQIGMKLHAIPVWAAAITCCWQISAEYVN